MNAQPYVIIDGKNISRRWLEQHPEAYPGVKRASLRGAGVTPTPAVAPIATPQARLIERIDLAMKEASRISDAIKKEVGSNPAMYAVNRAWHSLGTARDELTKI